MRLLSYFVLMVVTAQLTFAPIALANDPKDPKDCRPALGSYLEAARDAVAYLQNGDAVGAVRAVNDAANQATKEAPKVETPKSEAPKSEEPKSEAPKEEKKSQEAPKDGFVGKAYDKIRARVNCIAKRPLGYAAIGAVGILGSAMLAKNQKELESKENYVAGGLAIALGAVTVGLVGKPAFEGIMGCIRSYPIDPAMIPNISKKRIAAGGLSAAAPWVVIALQAFTDKKKKAEELIEETPRFPDANEFPRDHVYWDGIIF